MQSASTLLLSALIPIHPTTFHITSYWGAVVLPRFCSSQYVMCGCFFLIIFVSIVGDCLGSKIKSIYEVLFCQAIQMLFINSLGNSRNFLHNQWPEEFIKQKKPASKWHQIALYERWMCFCSNYRTILKSIVLLLRYCKRKWSPSYLNAKNRYFGMTGVTKKLHKSIAKLNYELNNSKKRCEG